MQRRSFLKSATAATLVASLPRPAFSAARYQMRIAFGGISIECSTYSRIRARMEDFNVLSGDALASSARFAFLKKYPVNFMPTVVASATPGGPVDRATYDAIKADFLKRLSALLPLDGLYLPMHGAMFVEGIRDAEGDWMGGARKAVGARCRRRASYDVPANDS